MLMLRPSKVLAEPSIAAFAGCGRQASQDQVAGERIMADPAEQRRNMVESQIRPSDITDRRIIRAMQKIEREKFLPEALVPLAYGDGALRLPAAPGQPERSELAPRVFAKLIQMASINEKDVVLDVGAATGYSSAVLASLAETVLALEEEPFLADRATQTIADLGLDNIVVIPGPLRQGYPSSGPYDVIVVEGAITREPEALLSQLKNGGRMVAILGSGTVGQAVCWSRHGETVSKHVGFDASGDVLPGFAAESVFVF